MGYQNPWLFFKNTLYNTEIKTVTQKIKTDLDLQWFYSAGLFIKRDQISTTTNIRILTMAAKSGRHKNRIQICGKISVHLY